MVAVGGHRHRLRTVAGRSRDRGRRAQGRGRWVGEVQYTEPVGGDHRGTGRRGRREGHAAVAEVTEAEVPVGRGVDDVGGVGHRARDLGRRGPEAGDDRHRVVSGVHQQADVMAVGPRGGADGDTVVQRGGGRQGRCLDPSGLVGLGGLIEAGRLHTGIDTPGGAGALQGDRPLRVGGGQAGGAVGGHGHPVGEDAVARPPLVGELTDVEAGHRRGWRERRGHLIESAEFRAD